ncbi:hypothetical protein ACGFU4_35915 [Streptomyces sp. NPDC048511]|uniref:hypothetical protein n=1 Tax=unclassified Streptomyces TaxID=2593676 RepID=UPI002E2B401F|nr:hypothetical protein [Streptomyces sp. NBC_01422]
MDFEFVCGWCGADCVVWGKPVGFWTEQYRMPADFDCWWCDGNNITPPPPWTPAD